MKNTEKNKQCCEDKFDNLSHSYNECDCKNYNGRKTPKIIICLFILMAAVSIITYKTIHTNNNGSNSSNSYNTANKIVYFNIPIFDTPIAFTFGQPVLENLPANDNVFQAEQNLGRYVESLSELNIVDIDNDVVIIYIPNSKNDLIDDKTKAAILNFQQDLARSKTETGLYTLWYETQDYSEIVRQTRIPAIVVARKGKGTVTMYGDNVNEYMLFQAYLRVANENCCEYFTPNCCN